LHCWEKAIEIKNYTDDFKRQAVDLYEQTQGATLRGIAADLGISRGTLADWVKALGSGARPDTGAHVSDGTAGSRLAAVEAENRQLRAEKVKLETERDILRQAAKYFAGEMTW
jgi:transposase